MTTTKKKTNSFCLYLAKEDVTHLNDLLTDNAKDLIRAGDATKITSSKFADESVVYIFPGHSKTPKWASVLAPTFIVQSTIKSKSPCALLIFKIDDRIFAATFSFAHVYLEDSMLQADYGLKVAVNSVSDKKVKSVERANLGFAIRGMAQSAKSEDLGIFGLDDALDLIRKVSGHAIDGLAANLTGAKSLKFSSKIDLLDIPEIATKSLALYNSKAYQKTQFKVIDFLSPVLDPVLSAQLDEELVRVIIDGGDDFEITTPKIVSDKITSYKFERTGFNDYLPDLSLELYRKALGAKLATLTVKTLKDHAIGSYNDTDSNSLEYWSVYHSLVGSVVLDKQRYALNESGWYRISKKVREAADKMFEDLCSPPDKNLPIFRKIIKTHKKKKKTYYQTEASYNEEVAAKSSYLLLDQKLVAIADKPGQRFEVCDLLDIPGRRFIHIKKSSRQSSILSHFFKQGANAARMLVTYEPFKAGVIEMLANKFDKKTADAFEAAINDKSKKWCVEFQIADFPRKKDGKHNIPFFSKLTLQEEARLIRSMGFDVKIRFIKLPYIEDGVNTDDDDEDEATDR